MAKVNSVDELPGELLKATGDTDAGVAADLMRRYARPRVIKVERGHDTAATVLALPKGMALHSVKELLDEYRTAPERRKGTARLADLDSFIAHANRFKDEDSALFADPSPTSPTLTSVIDYHHAGVEDLEDCDVRARFGEHRGVYAFPLSEAWEAWTKSNKTQMTQGDFAAFVEDRLPDIGDPGDAGDSAKALAGQLGASYATPSRLLDLSRGLSVRVGARVTNAQNLSTGEATMVFEASHQDEKGAPLRVPSAFLVSLPVFRSGALYQLAVRLRYRLNGGQVVWWFELHRPDRVFDHAFAEACEKAAKETGLPLYLGSPER